MNFLTSSHSYPLSQGKVVPDCKGEDMQEELTEVESKTKSFNFQILLGLCELRFWGDEIVIFSAEAAHSFSLMNDSCSYVFKIFLVSWIKMDFWPERINS